MKKEIEIVLGYASNMEEMKNELKYLIEILPDEKMVKYLYDLNREVLNYHGYKC